MKGIIEILSQTPLSTFLSISESELAQKVEIRKKALNLDKSAYTAYLKENPKELMELCFEQQSLLEHSNMLHSISQNVNEGIFRSELSKGLVYVNEAFVNIFGYNSKDDLLNMDALNFYAYPEDRKQLQALLLKDGAYSKREILFKRKDGSRFWGMISSIISTAPNGNTWFDGVITDISEKKEAEQTLKKLNKELLDQNRALEANKEALATSNKELTKHKEELEITLKKLSERNFELDQLVYKVSHDLRAPLSSVMGVLNIIKVEDSLKAREEYIALAESRLAKLDGFIRSMLTYAKANRSEITEEPIDFNELIEEALKDLEYLPQYEEMKLYSNINMKGLAFYGDRVRLQIVLSNVISNAFKYMHLNDEESHLKIDIYPRKGRLYLLFEDNGLGIEEKYLSRVFDMFFRGTNNSEGSGLGLYLVKQTVELLGGKIDFWSKPNKGTIFSIQLPMKVAKRVIG